jgi:hypothetical protein
MPLLPNGISVNLRGLSDMEYRRASVGYDAEDGTYFVCSAEFQHLTIEAKSLSALHHKLEALELRPVLSAIYAKDAPELRKASNAPEPAQDRA